MHRPRSTAGTLLSDVLGRLTEAYTTAPMPLDPVEYLPEGWLLDKALQLAGEVLLQRLSALLSSPLELGVDIFGEVSDEHVWNACSMQASAAGRNQRMS